MDEIEPRWCPLDVGDELPGAEHAQIEPEKLLRYALDPDSAQGQHKAAVFRAALDIEAEDWAYLRDAVRDWLPAHRTIRFVRPPTTPDERCTYGVLVPIRGLKSKEARTLLVLTAWELIEEVPHLTTIRVASERMQRDFGEVP